MERVDGLALHATASCRYWDVGCEMLKTDGVGYIGDRVLLGGQEGAGIKSRDSLSILRYSS